MYIGSLHEVCINEEKLGFADKIERANLKYFTPATAKQVRKRQNFSAAALGATYGAAAGGPLGAIAGGAIGYGASKLFSKTKSNQKFANDVSKEVRKYRKQYNLKDSDGDWIPDAFD